MENKYEIVGNIRGANQFLNSARTKIEKIWKEGNVNLSKKEVQDLTALVKEIKGHISAIGRTVKDFEEVASRRENISISG